MSRECRDCRAEKITTRRPAPHPGPRCATHHRRVMIRRREANHGRHIEQTYNLSRDRYDAILDVQGGQCAGRCGATGRTRRLAVDHDHSCCSGPTSCGKCVRGLLCKRCNRFIGLLRDAPGSLRALANYLENPPAKSVPVDL